MPLLVQAQQCATCIYRPDSPLDRAQLEAEIADPLCDGFFKGHRICHHSNEAVCRGFWNLHKDRFQIGQVAQRLGMVVFVNDDILKGRE